MKAVRANNFSLCFLLVITSDRCNTHKGGIIIKIFKFAHDMNRQPRVMQPEDELNDFKEMKGK